MKSIKPLSEVVHSSLHSSIILFDLTRVVEELVYNSLDAGASKVSVYVGVLTCFVKVVDNGSGITRNGLVLLGERYATSKLQNLNDMDATSKSFGFRGEALGSISDVSLLEIVTKAHGRPNGFRKVMKGCKCLYLGIDNGQDVGTTEWYDWVPILNFIEKAVTHIWSEKIAHGESCNLVAGVSKRDETWTEGGNIGPAEDLFTNSEIAEHSNDIQDHHDLLGFTSDTVELLTEDGEYMSYSEDNRIPFKKLQQDTADLKCQHSEMGLFHQANSYFQFRDSYLAKCTSAARQESDNHLLAPVYNCISEKDECSNTNFTTTEISDGYWEDFTLGTRWGTQFEERVVNIGNASRGRSLTCDINEFRNEVEVISKILKTPFLQNCSSQGLPTNEALFWTEKKFDFKMEGFGTKRKRLDPDWRVDVEAAGSDEKFKFSPRTLSQEKVTSAQSSSRIMTKFDMCADADFLSTADGHHFARENDIFSPVTAAQIGNFGLDTLSNLESCSATLDLLYKAKTWDVEDFTCQNARPKKENSKFRQAESVDDIFSPRYCGILMGDEECICLDSCGADNTENWVSSDIPPPMYLDKHKSKKDQLRFENYVPKERVRRSHSAPPFYEGKKRFFALNSHWSMKAERPSANTIFPETSELKHSAQSYGTCPFINSSFALDALVHRRPDMMKVQNITPDVNEVHKGEKFNESHGCHVDSDTDFNFESNADLVDVGIKWRVDIPPPANGDKAQNIHNHCSILDVSSGILHFAADSLVPESINKDSLEDAKVLQQVDKKFIPVVASGALAIIDQHAADERIRLEELQRKVLSGEMKTITYLDVEQELVLPEIGYQLMHNYTQQIQNWGWIFNNHSHISSSFTKNLNLLHKQSTIIKLLAVPCILGVNLSDLDLLEFLQQLFDTDGSSTMPPSVLRVLNLKACRGAIMFGDTLLLSECSLIVEELKRSSLCFQCAHGRPTTVPLVNLEALHRHIAKLGKHGGSNEAWHGLRRHAPNLERAAQRLSAAKGRS